MELFDSAKFTFIPSNRNSHHIKDFGGNLLAYHLHLPSHLWIIETLTEIEDLIPKSTTSKYK